MTRRAALSDGTRALAVLALLGLLGFGVWLYLQREGDDLDSSATGFRGLEGLLAENDVPVRWFEGYGELFADTIGLWVIPLYDTRPGENRDRPETAEEWLYQIDEVDRSERFFGRATRDLVPMFILPKWRSGVRLTGKAHPELLIPEERIEALLGSIGLEDAQILRMTGRRVQGDDLGQTEAHERQFLRHRACSDANDTSRYSATLLLCTAEIGDGVQQRFYVVADPDLMSNHGLSLGENAKTALAIVNRFRTDGDVVIDRSGGYRIVQRRVPDPAEPERGFDWARFLQPPFPLIAAALLGMALLALWRGAIRAAEPLPALARSPETARSVARGARARLMALSGQSAEVAQAYASARMRALAKRLLTGQPTTSATDLGALFQRLTARDAQTAFALSQAFEALKALDAAAPAPQVFAATRRFDAALEEILRDT